MKFNMDIYGLQQYNLIYTIINDEIDSLVYSNSITSQTAITSFRNKNLSIINVFDDKSDKRYSNYLFSLNKSKNRLLLNNPFPVIIRNYMHGVISPDKKYYTLDFLNDELKINMDIDINLITVYDKSQKLLSLYKSDEKGTIDTNKLQETYTFTSRGIFNKNYALSEDIALINNKEIKFMFIGNDHINESNNCDLLYRIPDIITYDNKASYMIEYDKFGLVSRCINITNKARNDTNLVKHYSSYDNFKTRIISVHPLFYDSFDPEYIDDGSLKYWAVDILVEEVNGIKSVSRKVYEILNETQLCLLIDDINNPEFDFT